MELEMGGSGGGGGGGYSASSFGNPDGLSGGSSCEELSFTTSLTNPDKVVLARLSVGDILDIQLEGANPAQPGVVAKHGGQTAGGIVSRQLPRLIQCLSGGTIYKAKITDLNYPLCKIHVYSA